MKLVKPKKLNKGDKVATISLSWGGAGELSHRYAQGKKQLEEIFGLEVIETKNALKSAKWIYDNVSSGTTVRIGDNLDYPLTNPTRYTWTGGAFGSDPTYR